MTYLYAPVNKILRHILTALHYQLANVNKEHAVNSCGDPKGHFMYIYISTMRVSKGESGDPDPHPAPLFGKFKFILIKIHLKNYRK